MKCSRRDEQHVVGLHRTILCRNRRAFDQRQQIALHAFAWDIPANPASLGAMTRDLEKEQIAIALQNHHWNQSATARSLGLTLRQLRYRIEKLELKQS